MILDSDRDQVLLPRATPGIAVVEVLHEVNRVHPLLSDFPVLPVQA